MDFYGEGVDRLDNCYNINIKRCSEIPNIPAVIKGVFLQILDTGYIDVGSYFEEMSDHDVSLLSELANRIHIENQHRFSEEAKEEALYYMTLFSLGMAAGEGLDLTDDNNEKYIRVGLMYISLESLFRHHLILVYHRNWSFDLDNQRPLAERLPEE